jgi:hypothetical protein
MVVISPPANSPDYGGNGQQKHCCPDTPGENDADFVSPFFTHASSYAKR